jgi:FMN-dependent NADH-azoreductase
VSRILLVHCSPHGARAHGHRLAREIIEHEQRRDGVAELIERDLSAEPLPPLCRGYAAAITGGEPNDAVALATSDRLIAELEGSDRLVIALPMHNFTVPAAFKLWIDHVVRIDRTFAATPQGKVGLLADRPTTVLVSSGGFHQGERARQPDFLSPYLRCVLNTIGIGNVTFVYLEGLNRGNDAVAAATDAARAELVAQGCLGTRQRTGNPA